MVARFIWKWGERGRDGRSVKLSPLVLQSLVPINVLTEASHVKKVTSVNTIVLCCFAIFLLGGTLTGEVKEFHGHSDTCQISNKNTCAFTCEQCHGEPLQPDRPSKLDNGDIAVCSKCHSWEKRTTGGFKKNCLYEMHRENKEYDLLNSSLNLREDPIGIKLFCDKDRYSCKVFCISCHNPKANQGEMSLLAGVASSYCHRCHNR